MRDPQQCRVHPALLSASAGYGFLQGAAEAQGAIGDGQQGVLQPPKGTGDTAEPVRLGVLAVPGSSLR